jgi:hypothetical protein
MDERLMVLTGWAALLANLKHQAASSWPWRLPRDIFQAVPDAEMRAGAFNRLRGGWLFKLLPPAKMLNRIARH